MQILEIDSLLSHRPQRRPAIPVCSSAHQSINAGSLALIEPGFSGIQPGRRKAFTRSWLQMDASCLCAELWRISAAFRRKNDLRPGG